MSPNDFLTCPACSSVLKKEETASVKYPSSKKGEGSPSDIYFCRGCELGIAYPSFSEKQLKELYFCGGYWEESRMQVIRPNNFPGQYVLAKSRWEFITEHTKNDPKKERAILDVGAGHGFCGMIAAEDKDITLREYCAVEASQVLRQSLARAWSKKKYRSELKAVDSIDKVDKKYDLIVLSHILEHMPDPKVFLAKIIGHLNENGFLFLDVPHKDYLFKNDVFPHLFFFSVKSMEALIKNTGLAVKNIDFYGRDISEAQKKNYFFDFIEKIFYKGRKIMPEGILMKFYSWRFKAFCKSPDGTWMRVLAKNGS